MTEPVDRLEVFGETEAAAERIAPGFAPPKDVEEHLARYRWAAQRLPGGRVLDVACGVGYGAAVLRGAGSRQVLSVDRWLPALWFGIERYELAAACAEASALPFPDGALDAVVSLETIEHLEDVPGFLEEVARVLIPEGFFLVSSPNLERSKGTNPYHLSEMTLPTLTSLLDAAGFTTVQVTGQHWDVLWGVLWRVRGIARLARRVDRSPRVGRAMLPGSRPGVFCVMAVNGGPATHG